MGIISKYATARGLLAGAAILSCIGLGVAHAEGCPAGQTVADGKGQPKSNLPASGVTDTVISTNDVSGAPFNIKDRTMRLRRLVIQPGGVVPWHSHGDRPAIIYIISGQIVEYASTCAVPILHTAGEATPETATTKHWWKNETNEPVVLLSADLFHKTAKDDHMM